MHIESLSVGDWIAVTEAWQEHDVPPWCPAEVPRGGWSIEPCDGEAMEVLAVSPPFIIAMRHGGPCTLDIRRVRLTKLDRRYVRTMRRLQDEMEEEEAEDDEQPAPLPAIEAKRCPCCSAPLVERMMAKKPGRWLFCCNECGFQGSAK